MSQNQLFLAHLACNTLTELKPSAVGGVGVFACCDIPAQTQLFVPFPSSYQSPPRYITHTEFACLPSHVQQRIKKFCVDDRKGYPVPEQGMFAVDNSFYLNHSITPNVRTSPGDYWTNFFTRRHIQKNEELTILYNELYS